MSAPSEGGTTPFPIRPFGRRFVPVPTGAESADFDRWAIDEVGVPQPVLMENAGRAAASVVDTLVPEGPVVGVVGTGNNGGDALVALRTLAAAGRRVRAVSVGDRGPDPLLHGWGVAIEEVETLGESGWSALLADAAVIVDGLLGTGISGPPREPHADAIRRVNVAAAPVIALDVPSGVDADTGAVPGDVVRAACTVSFGFPKLGVLLHPGRASAGRVVAYEIGFPPADPERFGARAITPGWVASLPPDRALDTHKNAVGALLVLAGRRGMAGAAVLATRGALRGGAGFVRVATHEANRTVVQAAVPEAVFVDASEDEALREAVRASAAVVAGPGLGTDDWAESRLAAVLDVAGKRPALLDADALNLLSAGRPAVAEAVAAGRPTLLTPHPGEMARLAGASVGEVSEDRPGAARALARQLGCAVLLKGTPSLVASPEGPLLVATTSGSHFASAGMGDLLAGVAGALLARGLAPDEAAAAALHVTGRAALLAGAGPALLPTDVAEALPVAWREEGAGSSDLPAAGLLFDQDPPR